MIVLGGRPGGNRLRPGSSIKIKGLQIQRKPVETTNRAFWVNWNWSTWIKTQIDLAAALGANCVKFPGSSAGVVQGLQTQAALNGHVQQAIEYADSLGLLVYFTAHMPYSGDDLDPATDAATRTAIASMMGTVGAYPNVIGADCSNEPWLTIGSARALANQQTLYPLIKGVAPDLPLSMGISISSQPNFASSNIAAMTAVAPYLDFWDFHPYYDVGDPVNADLNAFRALGIYKPFLIGECGQTIGAGQAAQTSRWTAIGAIAATATDCYGAVGYTTADTNTGNGDYGLYTQDGAFTERTWMTTAFKAWTSRR